eukprot:TRINITY_DN2559_c0_g1_i1.p1 TRINITY_DN2559_c0_g1~~TRINITY_DN2559_c0_g1_i1.p1  ORF type:complete len:438 (-),score=31.66 TRINITY_DN2559_c0_g1_i1:309-1622(-)
MRGLGRFAFGQQGLETSRDCAFHVCTVCNANIRLSYWVVFFFMYSLVKLLDREVHKPHVDWRLILWEMTRMCGGQIILLGTILCHEFGHGNMARWLGGEIDHVLLWVFGGICFSTRPACTDKRKVLRNDLLVVGAGPLTHLLQAPLWIAVMAICFALLPPITGFDSIAGAATAALDPTKHFSISPVVREVGLWRALPWALAADAVRLNVSLFMFNVFFPMYPADGSKLLVLFLMFCLRAPPRCAAIVLLSVSIPCALILISGAFDRGGVGHLPDMMHGVLLWMGIMSLCEAFRIASLLNEGRLHTHPLFETARSWQRPSRDSYGSVNRINTSNLDDEEVVLGGSGCCCRDVCLVCCGDSDDENVGGNGVKHDRLCLPLSIASCCCPCCIRDGPQKDLVQLDPEVLASSSALRTEREGFLGRLEQQSMAMQPKRPPRK